MINKRIVRLGLTIVGVIGIPLTSYLSVRAHDRAKLVEDKKEKLKCYAPAIISGIISGGCIIGRDIDASREIAALATTATYAVANRNKLEEKLGQLLPKEEAKKLKDMAEQKALSPHKDQSIEWTGHGTLKVLEGYSGRLFYSSLDKVKEAEEKISRRFSNGEYVCMNDFYGHLGITQTHFGHQWGWVPNDDWYPNWYEDNPLGFENELVEDEDGNPLLVIEVMTYPMEGWMEV